MYKDICLTLLVVISSTNLYINTIEPRMRQRTNPQTVTPSMDYALASTIIKEYQTKHIPNA